MIHTGNIYPHPFDNKQIEINKFLDTLWNQFIEYKRKNNKNPKYIYLGDIELYYIYQSKQFAQENLNLTSKKETIWNIEIIRVSKDSHLNITG